MPAPSPSKPHDGSWYSRAGRGRRGRPSAPSEGGVRMPQELGGGAADGPRGSESVQLAVLRGRLRAGQRPLLAVIAGAIAAAAGAAGWAAVTVYTGHRAPFLAIGVGALVGLAIRRSGNGVHFIFGVAGATLALGGCLAGNLLAAMSIAGSEQGVGLSGAVRQLDVKQAADLMAASLGRIDLLFYAVALLAGFRLSFRRIS